MANFKHAYKFCSMLMRDYAADETCLDLSSSDENKLCSLLAEDGCYTRLVVDTATGCEVVTVTCAEGSLKIDRGQENFAAQAWEKGSLIYFDWTPQNLLDWADCNSDATDEENEPPFKSENFNVVWDEENEIWCVEPKDDDGLSGKYWDSCGNRFSVKDGKIVCEPAPPEDVLTAGTYDNATVVIKDGKIVSVQKGCNVIAQGCTDGCACEKCSNEGN